MLSDVSSQLNAVFVAFGHPTRRAILRTLAFRPATVTQLAEEHHVSLPAIHRHIRLLEQADLLQRRKVGRINFVAQKRAGIRVAQDWLGQFATQFGNDGESLDNYIAQFK